MFATFSPKSWRGSFRTNILIWYYWSTLEGHSRRGHLSDSNIKASQHYQYLHPPTAVTLIHYDQTFTSNCFAPSLSSTTRRYHHHALRINVNSACTPRHSRPICPGRHAQSCCMRRQDWRPTRLQRSCNTCGMRSLQEQKHW